MYRFFHAPQRAQDSKKYCKKLELEALVFYDVSPHCLHTPYPFIMDNNNSMLRALQHEEELTARRVRELEQIIADGATGLVQRSKAQVELAQLTHGGSGGGNVDVRALDKDTLASAGVVTKNKAKVECDIEREHQRIVREAEIERITAELQVEAKAAAAEASAGREHRRTRDLKEQLRQAEEAIRLMDIEDAEEAKNRAQEAEAEAEVELDHEKEKLTRRATSATVESENSNVASVTQANPQAAEPAPPRGLQRRKSSMLRGEIAKLQMESLARQAKIERVNIMLQEEEKENNQRIQELSEQLEKMGKGVNEREALVKHWHSKARRLSVKCLNVDTTMDEKEQFIQELEDWKNMQEERLAALQKHGEEEAAPAPVPKSRPSMGARQFTRRASVDPTFASALKRAKTKGNMEDQLREETKIEVAALEERLAVIDGEKGELIAELQAMKNLLKSTAPSGKGKKKKKNRDRLVYQLSCKKCNKNMVSGGHPGRSCSPLFWL